MWRVPAVTATAELPSPVTSEGTAWSEVPPLPIWPCMFFPQQYKNLPVAKVQEWSPPATTWIAVPAETAGTVRLPRLANMSMRLATLVAERLDLLTSTQNIGDPKEDRRNIDGISCFTCTPVAVQRCYVLVQTGIATLLQAPLLPAAGRRWS